MTEGWPLGASTLGAPGAPFTETATDISRFGGSWVELRLAAGELTIDSDAALRASARDAFHRAGVEVRSVASYIRVAQQGGEVDEDLDNHLLLAAELGASFLRVFPGGGSLVDEVVDARATQRLRAASPRARSTGVTILVETHDSHPTAGDVVRILAPLGSDAPVGVIWDVLHPWRAGEDFDTTWRIASPYLQDSRGYVQLKDVRSRSDPTPTPPGQGCLPLDELRRTLLDGGYGGGVSLEWERAWFPEIGSLAQALGFARRWIDGD